MPDKVKVLARGWKLEVSDMEVAPAYEEVLGLESFEFSGSKTDAPATSFDSEGWEEHLVATRGKSLTANGFYLEDQTTKDRDPGQQLVESHAEKMGAEALINFKLTSPAGKLRAFKASVEMQAIGGANAENTKWGFNLTVSGKFLTELSAGLTALAGIQEEGGAALVIIPAFDVDTYAYSAVVNTLSTYVKVTPTAAGGQITVNGAVVPSASESGQILVALDALTAISIIQAEVNKTPRIYKLVIARP